MEATVICLDNSEWMRNGDYPPNRFEAQNDAANFISTAKIEANPESSVAIISMAGRTGPKVLVSLSADIGGLLNSIASVKIEGKIDVLATLQVAKLALKHKPNKSQRQRILMFIGSPISTDTKELVQMGKILKKNNIAVDIINFGEIIENDEKLTAFYNAVNSNGNPSHIIPVPPGPHILSDYLVSVPSLFGDSFSGAAGGAAGADDSDIGFDASLDPELAHALRMSLEDERQRRARTEESQPAETEASQPAPSSTGEGSDAMEVDSSSQANTVETKDEDAMQDDEDDPYANLTEEEEMRLAMQLSMQASETPSNTSEQKTESSEPENTWSSQVADAMNDPNFVDSIFSEIGADPNDPLIQDTLKQFQKEKDKDEKNE